MSQFFDINSRPDPDELIIQIADYVMDYEIQSDEAYETAKSCLIDSRVWLASVKFSSLHKITWASC